MEIMEIIIGSGESLTPVQMAVRAFMMFLIALLFIRLGGMRMMGKKSAFDLVITIMLGAVMARGIVGASPFFSTVAAAGLMIAVNRLLAWSTAQYKFFNKLIKGSPLVLFEHGKFIEQNMSEANLSFADIEMSLRLETRKDSFESVSTVTLETNGRISFVLLDHQQ